MIAAAITSKTAKAPLPTHITLCGGSCGLPQDSIVLLEQVRTLDKCRLREYAGRLDSEKLCEVDKALQISFGLCSVTEEP